MLLLHGRFRRGFASGRGALSHQAPPACGRESRGEGNGMRRMKMESEKRSSGLLLLAALGCCAAAVFSASATADPAPAGPVKVSVARSTIAGFHLNIPVQRFFKAWGSHYTQPTNIAAIQAFNDDNYMANGGTWADVSAFNGGTPAAPVFGVGKVFGISYYADFATERGDRPGVTTLAQFRKHWPKAIVFAGVERGYTDAKYWNAVLPASGYGLTTLDAFNDKRLRWVMLFGFDHNQVLRSVSVTTIMRDLKAAKADEALDECWAGYAGTGC
jgi:hypothetical protein